MMKDARKIEVDGQTYFWKVGSTNGDHCFANLVVQAPTGRYWKRVVRVRKWNPAANNGDGAYEGVPVTPADARALIEDKRLEQL